MNKKSAFNLTCAAMCLALCLVLPLLTMQIPEIGRLLSPMHLPVLICGLVCGWKYGTAVGFVAPLLRFAIFQMPPIFPTGVTMAAELAVYGLVTGILYSRMAKKPLSIYIALFAAMFIGRVAGGAVNVVLLGLGYVQSYSFSAFITAYFAQTLPGMICHVLIVPPVVILLEKLYGHLPIRRSV